MTYAEQIVRATGCPPKDAGAIEQLMRLDPPTLDALVPGEFGRLARICATVLAELRASNPATAAYYEGDER